MIFSEDGIFSNYANHQFLPIYLMKLNKFYFQLPQFNGFILESDASFQKRKKKGKLSWQT